MEICQSSYNNPKYEDEIVSVYFFPKEEYIASKIREKGKRYWWRLFGIIPIFRYTEKEDQYIGINRWCVSLQDLCDSLNCSGDTYYYDSDDGKIYKEALVKVNYINKKNQCLYSKRKWFASNESAVNYYNKMIFSIKKD